MEGWREGQIETVDIVPNQPLREILDVIYVDLAKRFDDMVVVAEGFGGTSKGVSGYLEVEAIPRNLNGDKQTPGRPKGLQVTDDKRIIGHFLCKHFRCLLVTNYTASSVRSYMRTVTRKDKSCWLLQHKDIRRNKSLASADKETL